MEDITEYISNNLPGVIALLGIILTVLYYAIEIPNIEISNIIKSPIGKGSFSKPVIVVAIISVVVLTIFYLDSCDDMKYINLQVEEIQAILICMLTITFIVLLICILVHHKVKKSLHSKNDVYAFTRRRKSGEKLITRFDVIQIVIYLITILICSILIIGYCLYIYNKNIKEEFIVDILALSEIGIMFLTNGYILAINNLISLKKYIIITNQFENGYVEALIVTETESQLLIKCEKSYPIILNKSEVKAYICIDYLSDDEVNNLIEDRIGEDNSEDKLRYEGYYLAKEKSGVNNKY